MAPGPLSYDPLKASYEEIIGRLEMIGRATEEIDLPAAEVITIPVLYGGDFGIDLDYVAGHNKLPAEEVVRIHSSVEYLVYLLGFTPGFPCGIFLAYRT